MQSKSEVPVKITGIGNSPDGKGTSVSNTSAGLFVSDLREPTATPFVDIVVSFEGVQDEMLVHVRCLVLDSWISDLMSMNESKQEAICSKA